MPPAQTAPCMCHRFSWHLPIATPMNHRVVPPPALQSAVYRAGGRRAFSGEARHLHAPARRLARTIIGLGPQEGLAFGLQAMRAIEATAGAGSGDLHRYGEWGTARVSSHASCATLAVLWSCAACVQPLSV